MYKSAIRQTTLFTLVHRADLVLTSRAAGALHHLLLHWPDNDELRDILIANSYIALMGLSAGSLFALVTTFLL